MHLPTIKSEKILPGSSGPGYRFWVGSEIVVGSVAGVRWKTKGKTRWSYTGLNPGPHKAFSLIHFFLISQKFI